MKINQRLIHYSAKPLVAVRSVGHSEKCGAYKTPGLWVSVEGDDDWPSWCMAEGWELESLAYATEVVLCHNVEILWLKTEQDIDDFTVEFTAGKFNMIDWPRVRKLYSGLVISPYQWGRRLSCHTSWYYGWDCASGVIWDARAVAHLRLVQRVATARDREGIV